MNLSTVMSMSKEELRIEIAESLKCEWVESKVNGNLGEILFSPKKEKVIAVKHKTGEIEFIDCPNWPDSIEAAYALEESMPEEKRDEYINSLCFILSRETGAYTDYEIAHATAHQKSMAYYLTMGVKE